jgi:hypothetical protein
MWRRAHNVCRWTVALLAVIAGSRDLGADDSQLLLRRFREEAPAGWANLERAERGLEFFATVTQTDTWTVERKVIEKDKKELRWRARPGCLLVEETRYAGGQPALRLVTAKNEGYFFRVSQQVGKTDWRLQEVGPLQTPDAGFKSFLVYHGDLSPLTFFPSLTRPRLAELIADPACNLEDARPIGDFVAVQLGHREKYLELPEISRAGTIVFDPAMNWAVREFEFMQNSFTKISWKAELSRRDLDGYRPVASTVLTTMNSVGSTRRKLVIDSVERANPAPGEFRLSAYGLPEPIFEGQPSSAGRSWLIAGAFASACATILFWRLSRRASRAALAKPSK